MTLADFKRKFSVGGKVEVENHYISRRDHPCFGTHVRTIKSVSQAGWTSDIGGYCKFPKSKDIRELTDGAVCVFGYPTADSLFLTIRFL